MRKIILFIFISAIVISCNEKTKKDNTENNDSVSVANNIGNSDAVSADIFLYIEGNQIWVREEPKNGDVVLKLDDGTKCKVIEKGEEQIINGVKDYWYKIEYEGTKGWVFGSQTSLKATDDVDENEQIENLFEDLFQNIKSQNYAELKNYFVDDSVFVIYNPGAICVYTNEYYKKGLDYLKNIQYNGKIKFGTEPQFDMDLYEWSENGFFVNKNTATNSLSAFDQNLTEYYTEYIMQKARGAEKNISYRFLSAYNDGIFIYFGKINNRWKIIAIDASTNDA